MIGKEARDAKGLRQGCERQEHLGSATAKDIRQDLSGPVINGVSEPAWLLLLTDKALHFVDFSGLHSVNAHCSVIRPSWFHQRSSDRREDRSLFFTS